MVPPAPSPRWKQVMATALSLVLALGFLVAGIAKLLGGDPYPELFGQWGLPPWVRVFTGILEVLGAAVLLPRRTAAAGANLLGAVALAMLAMRLAHGEWLQAMLPLVALLMLLPVGCVRGSRLYWWLGACGRPSDR